MMLPTVEVIAMGSSAILSLDVQLKAILQRLGAHFRFI